MKARITQIIAKLIAAAAMPIALWLGGEAVNEGQVLDTASSIAAGIVSLGALLVDLVVHKVETGGIFQSAGDRTPAAQRAKINRSTRGVLLACLLLPALTMGGCAANPVDEWHQARQTQTQLKAQMLNLHTAGAISDRELVAMEQYVRAADDALGAWQAALPRDEDGQLDPDGEMAENARFYAELVADTLGRIQHRLQQLKKESADEPDSTARSPAPRYRRRAGGRGPTGLCERPGRPGRSGRPLHGRSA